MLHTTDLNSVLEHSASMHDHLCPRQVLGARMGLYARELLGVNESWHRKRLFVFVETDGCFADGISAATNCWLGHRTLRLVDYGKVAATFVDTETERALRIVPQPHSREWAAAYMPDAPDHWHAQRDGYKLIPAEELLRAHWVTLNSSMDTLISEPKGRVHCTLCGEEIINHREVIEAGAPYCPRCAGADPYYTVTGGYAGVLPRGILEVPQLEESGDLVSPVGER
jgi:formylmethanofuran dehydrogenase subunit E